MSVSASRPPAPRRGVAGWVQNRPDGTVEVVLEGEPEPMGSLVRFCGEDPRAAWVARVETATEQPEGLRGFEIR